MLRISGLFAVVLCALLWSGCGGESKQEVLSGEQQAAPAEVVARPTETPAKQPTPPSQVVKAAPAKDSKPAPPKSIEKPRDDRLASAGASAPRERTFTLPIGTVITGELETLLSSKTNQVGDVFRLIVAEPIVVEGTPVIPRGTVIHGTVKTVEPAERGSKKASMGLEFNALSLISGVNLPIVASQSLEGEEEVVDAQIEGESKKKRNAALVAGGAAVGAVAGKLLGKGKVETVVGAVTGAAAGTAVAMALKGGEVELKEGTPLTVKLGKALQVPVRVATGSNVAADK